MADRRDQELVLSAGTVPIRVGTVGEAILRVAIADRGDAPPSSYLPARPPARGPMGAQLAVEVADGVLSFRSADGGTLLRFAIDSAHMHAETGLRFEVVGEQHFYGLGEGGQQFDRLGITRRFWNFQANRGQGADIAIPLLVSQAGYALFFDNSAAAHLETADVYDGTWIEYKTAAASLDFYVIGGRDLRAVFAGVADLLGHATMPPRWALGYMQSSRHFDSPDEVRELARSFRDKGCAQLPRQGYSMRRADLSLDLRRRQGDEPWCRLPGIRT